VVSIIPHLEQTGLLRAVSPPQLTSQGLSELSKWLASLQCENYEYVYWSYDDLPFFPYYSSPKKDTIFYPNLSFDLVKAYIEDNMSVVYVTSLPEVDFSIENLNVLSNLLLEHEPLTPIGFWLLKYSRKRVCGWSVDNLEKTIQLMGQPVSMTFLCGLKEYVIVISSKVDQKKLSKLNVKIYITKENFAYVDTLGHLRDKLKPFLIFHQIPDFLEGQEISLEKSGWWDGLPEPGLRIVPDVKGKIYYKDNKYEFDPIPLVVVLSPEETKTRLAAISPWFITCPAGCDEKKISERELHRMHSFRVLNLPEIDIVTFMINNVT
jgi:hypothetical protein